VARPALILMAGLPGSGKSTFARRLAGATGATVLESDALRQLLFGGPTHEAAESHALFGAIFEAAGTLLRDGHTVIIDATNLKRSDRRPAHDLVAATGASLVIVRTVAPEPIILERLIHRELMPDRDDHSLAGTAVYRHMAEEALPIIEEHREIDTSDERATDAALVELTEELRLMGATNPAVAHVTGGSIS
jgi:predicted kinase